MRRGAIVEPLRVPQAWEVAWAAGFLEGDGSFGFTQTRPTQRPYLRIRVDQVEPSPLVRLQAIFGGSTHISGRRTSAGNAVHRWQVAGARAENVARMLYPYLTDYARGQLAPLNLSSEEAAA